MGNISDQEFKAIIADGDYDMLVQVAEAVGRDLARTYRLSTSQIRGIFGTVRRIEMDWIDPARLDSNNLSDQARTKSRQAQREFALLQPRLAYQAQRERGRGVQALKDALLPAIKIVNEIKADESSADKSREKYERFRNFVNFFEAILAYHRANGGQ